MKIRSRLARKPHHSPQTVIVLEMSVAEAIQFQQNCLAVRILQNVDTSALKQFDEVAQGLREVLR